MERYNLTYSYSCAICGQDFKDNKELKIQLDLSPICSSKCIFRLYYNILSNYDKRDLLYLAGQFNIKNFKEFKDNKLIYEVCKKYPKPSLASINTKRTEDKDRTGQDRQRTEDRTTPPLYNRGVSCTFVLSFPSSINHSVQSEILKGETK